MNSKLSTLLIALPLLASAYQPAHAAINGKTLPGAACQPLTKDAVFSVNSFGVLLNTSTTAFLTVICPVVRDTIGSNGISSAQIMAIDNHTTLGVSCTLDSRSTTTGLFSSRTANSAAGTNPSPQALSYPGLPSSFGGYYMFRCTIPPQQTGASGIVMYRVDENE
jgi:hypothetical protein